MKDPASHVPPQEAEGTEVGSVIPRVLLLRNDPAGASSLVNQLQQFGCECQIASFRDGVALLDKQHFHIVFSDLNISEGTMSRLISHITSSNASLFFHLEVEDGCWWLPVVVTGQNCSGTPALRPNDFHLVLKELVRQMASGAHQSSSQDSAVFVQLVPSAFTVRRVDNEEAHMDSRGQADSTATRKENRFQTATNES
jgi:CheY-like chemotaxis protein